MTEEAAKGRRRLHLPAGSLTSPPWSLDLSQESAGWSWASLRVLQLGAGESHRFSAGEDELLVLPLSGGCHLSCDGQEQDLHGRTSVFERPSDFAYVPRDAWVTVASEQGGRFAVAGAKARRRLPFRYQPVERVAVELRGAGSCSRRVVNYCMPDDFEADRLIVCEVMTPSGNWSSYPPHKHDQARPGETELEEIYYFEVAGGPEHGGVGYQRIYGTEERPVDLLAEVRSGDVVLVPHGYHGPSMAPPGYDLYYLNVMAGPGERAWLVTDDPEHAWIRATWDDQAPDPRLAGTAFGQGTVQ
jgi:5-deoxy-glucuronate isomerase